MIMKLTRENFAGPWAGLPVAWTEDDQFDEEMYRGDVARCCRAGVPGVYSGGTTGEFYAMEWDEFCGVARATVEESHRHGKPAMIGCTSTYTRGACRRAEVAAELGADAVQVALPFWMEVEPSRVVPFFAAVSKAAGGLPLSVYDTTRTRHPLGLDEHRAIAEHVPDYLMAKANAGTVGCTPEGCRTLSRLVNVFVNEVQWAELGPCGVRGACSAMVYWNPALTLAMWDDLEQQDWRALRSIQARLDPLFTFLHEEFGSRGFTDTAFDRLCGVGCGFLKTSLRSRGPYVSATGSDVELFRSWCTQHLPELLPQ